MYFFNQYFIISHIQCPSSATYPYLSAQPASKHSRRSRVLTHIFLLLVHAFGIDEVRLRPCPSIFPFLNLVSMSTMTMISLPTSPAEMGPYHGIMPKPMTGMMTTK